MPIDRCSSHSAQLLLKSTAAGNRVARVPSGSLLPRDGTDIRRIWFDAFDVATLCSGTHQPLKIAAVMTRPALSNSANAALALRHRAAHVDRHSWAPSPFASFSARVTLTETMENLSTTGHVLAACRAACGPCSTPTFNVTYRRGLRGQILDRASSHPS